MLPRPFTAVLLRGLCCARATGCCHWQPVVQKDAAGATLLRGVIVLGPDHTVADMCKMLRTELQMAPTGARLHRLGSTLPKHQLAARCRA